MGCPDARTWARYLAGGAIPDERSLLASHADSCAQCHHLLKDYASLSDAFIEPPELPANPGEKPLEPGLRVSRYQLRDWLGAGTMGAVWQALDTVSGKEVALKLLRRRPDLPAAHATDKLVREAKAMGRVSHPNIVPVFDVGVDGERVFIAMELIHGRTLRAWLREKPRSAQEILGLFAQAGAGMVAAHAAGIVHRDLKPENILVDAAEKVHVVDFGLALAGTETTGGALTPPPLTDPGSLRGTPVYMAPEQHQRAGVDALADQYTFCLTLFEILYGRRLRPGEVLLIPRTPMRADLTRRTHRAILRGLRERPSARFPDMAALLKELEAPPPGWLGGRWPAFAVRQEGAIDV